MLTGYVLCRVRTSKPLRRDNRQSVDRPPRFGSSTRWTVDDYNASDLRWLNEDLYGHFRMSRRSNGIPAQPLFVTDCDYRCKRLLWMTAISKVHSGAALSPFYYLSPLQKAINVAGKTTVIKHASTAHKTAGTDSV